MESVGILGIVVGQCVAYDADQRDFRRRKAIWAHSIQPAKNGQEFSSADYRHSLDSEMTLSRVGGCTLS